MIIYDFIMSITCSNDLRVWWGVSPNVICADLYRLLVENMNFLQNMIENMNFLENIHMACPFVSFALIDGEN